MQFVRTSYSTNEKSGAFSATLMRTGDLSYTSTLRCYTRSMTAQVQRDFKERTDTDASIILFNPGETRKSCAVTIVDDLVFEGQETFKLKIGSADRNTRIGEKNDTEIAILDEADSKYFDKLDSIKVAFGIGQLVTGKLLFGGHSNVSFQ